MCVPGAHKGQRGHWIPWKGCELPCGWNPDPMQGQHPFFSRQGFSVASTVLELRDPNVSAPSAGGKVCAAAKLTASVLTTEPSPATGLSRWPPTHGIPPTLVSQVLGFQAWITTPDQVWKFCSRILTA